MKKIIGSGITAFLVLVLLMYLVAAQTAASTIIALQGKLTNESTGVVIPSATLRVNISTPAGITVWNETYTSAVSNGFFDLLLGTNSNNPLNLTFNQDYNISIYVGSSAQQIGGTYRFRGGQGMINPSNISAGNFSASGNYSFGSTVFVDKTNNRVGIGTTGPSSKLEVTGADDNTYGQLRVNSTGSDARIELWNMDGSNTSGRGSIFMSRTEGYQGMRFMTGGNDRMIIDKSGNVGIGTTNPTKILAINGTLAAVTFDPSAGTPTLNTTGNGGENISIASGAGSVIIQLG